MHISYKKTWILQHLGATVTTANAAAPSSIIHDRFRFAPHSIRGISARTRDHEVESHYINWHMLNTCKTPSCACSHNCNGRITNLAVINDYLSSVTVTVLLNSITLNFLLTNVARHTHARQKWRCFAATWIHRRDWLAKSQLQTDMYNCHWLFSSTL